MTENEIAIKNDATWSNVRRIHTRAGFRGVKEKSSARIEDQTHVAVRKAY